MGKIEITLDQKHLDKFLVKTSPDCDISIFGWETKRKFESYYMNMSPWNLVDLFQNRKKYDLEIIYDPIVEAIVENLRKEISIYKHAERLKKLPESEIDDIWEEENFPILFPNVKADMCQKRAVLWGLETRKCGLYLEQGVGKTLVGILLIGKLLADELIKKPLVVAPLSLLSKTAWFGDLKKFCDLRPINLRTNNDYIINGDINFINADKFDGWCFHKTEKAEKSYNKDNYFEMRRFDCIFFDESSMLKGHSSFRTRGFLEIAKYAKYLFFASGTPAPNKIFQIWSQMKAIGSVLGDSYPAFEQRYGVERTVGPTKLWFPTKNAEYEIRRRIDLVSYFVKREDVMTLPPRDDSQIIEVELPEDHRKLYDAVESDYIYAAQGMDESGNQLEGNVIVTHETAVRMKLLQIINGFVDIEDIDGRKSRVSLPWNAKLIALENKVKEILESDPSNNIIIWCRFRWEVETIYQMYKEIASYIYGGLTDKKREEVLTRWKNNDFCRIMVGMPSAAKFGHTWLKANYVIYYSGTEDYEDYAQSRDRNYRRGQTRPVTEIKIITKNTIERRVWYCIATKKKVDKFLKDFYIEKAKG